MNEPLSTPAPYAWVKGDYEIIIDLERQLADVKAQLAERTRENDAIRELMNTYNLGGWTDAVEPMKRALAAEQRERETMAVLTDAEVNAAIYPDVSAEVAETFSRNFPNLHAKNRRVFDAGYRAGLRDAAKMAGESARTFLAAQEPKP